MTNFDFLLSSPDFSFFGETAVAAEKKYSIDPAACVMTCRRTMENAVKWMYSVDSALSMPWDQQYYPISHFALSVRGRTKNRHIATRAISM